MGESVFGAITKGLTQPIFPGWCSVSQEDYEWWKQIYTWDSLQNCTSYGQSFCKHFNIVDNILVLEHNWQEADDYIRNNYVSK